MVIKGHDMPKRPATLSSVGLFLFLVVNSVAPANFNVSVLGTVKDAGTGDPLPSANVIIVGTSLGSATDVEGRYLIRNVPPGAYILRASYMGYQTVEVPLEVVEGESSTKDFELEPVALEGEEVVVTAQARGQNVAINTQLASNSIVSVVSSARIQELPDANAAEAIGRLPGVSVLRSGGEGTQIVIRGLQPKYNAVMVDGVRMASSNSSDRSADLSMISPHMLEGIEVTKAVTPDQGSGSRQGQDEGHPRCQSEGQKPDDRRRQILDRASRQPQPRIETRRPELQEAAQAQTIEAGKQAPAPHPVTVDGRRDVVHPHLSLSIATGEPGAGRPLGYDDRSDKERRHARAHRRH